MRSSINRVILSIVRLLDLVVPNGRRVVIRTFPDYDDQAREVGNALHHRGIPMTILVEDRRPPRPPLDFPCRVVGAKTPRGAWEYARAKVVVHTHGVFDGIAGSGSKRFVNLWHGMPIKRLPVGSPVGRHQSDVALATSPVHRANLATTWEIAEDRIEVVGLPRNDALLRRDPDTELLRRSGLAQPLAVWLPTVRSRPGKPGRADGTDLGTATQFDGADLPRLDAAMARHGFHLLVKPHPAAAPPEPIELGNVTVWREEDLRRHGWTLYRLLAHADLLLTDISSVWVDFLVTDRPIIFAMSDRDEYLAGRGSYFDDLDELLPGPICTDFDQLDDALARHATGADPWRERRSEVRAEHQTSQPGTSSDVVAGLIERELDRTSNRSGSESSEIGPRS